VALEPENILVIANRNADKSVGLAKYSMEKRSVPQDHLLALWVTDRETCTREAYERKVLPPVVRWLREHPEKFIQCLVTVYGVPLKVLQPEMTAEEQAQYDAYEEERKQIQEQVNRMEEETEEKEQLEQALRSVREKMARVSKRDQRASLDSELALALAAPYDLSGRIPNPYFLGYKGNSLSSMPAREEILLVSRLDGPSPEIVRRIVDDAVEVEKQGLHGNAYFDARWPRPPESNEPEKFGYGFFDLSIHRAAERVRKSGRTPVQLDAEGSVFPEGSCPEAALYCGWYSYGKYVDAFEWRPGPVGYHIASSECTTLRNRKSPGWCKRMLEEMVAATLGPVWEPYVQAFPAPEIFFGLLVDGRWTLAECYALSLPFWSLQMVLVGDPLYRPFQPQSSP